ncbi:hypothetical protein M139_3162 [Bacteroides fragilis str. S23L24]|nr:hypothetical protein M139_3162 [Bacteroides fragilis str. S23L24]
MFVTTGFQLNYMLFFHSKNVPFHRNNFIVLIDMQLGKYN